MSVISEQDRHTHIDDFNATDDVTWLGHRLDQLFESIAEEYVDNIALIHDETRVTYQELNSSANLLARGLASHGLKHADVVGLAVSRSIDLIVVIIAVLKVGAAYVPIDANFPAERISQMIEDANPKFILTSGTPTAGLSQWKDLCLSVDETRDGSIIDASNLETNIQVQDLAYIIYTSGSTGRPKGVEISHGAASNFLTSLRRREPGCGENDRLLAITTISFDMSVLELLLPILSGATMIIAQTNAVKDPRELLTLMKRHAVTVMQATPATWTMLLESQREFKLSKIICGGEPLTRRLADRLLVSADSVWNVYGPSETTYGSVGRVSEHGEIVVGNPVANGRIYVLDDNLSPVPMGADGEIYIGGGSVSNGYRNNPELTQSRFLDNPFHEGRFFRTGDLGRFIAPGKLQVLGRVDGMVKIRGFRIEVGDIEAAIVGHKDLSEAVVVSRDDRLVAYCVLNADSTLSSPGQAPRILLDRMLRPWLASRLPDYMVPAFFVKMDVLPLSPNQKVDRKALPDPVAAIQVMPDMRPTTETEQQIQDIWSRILGHDRIGIEDNFFQIGGDSMRVILVQAELERLLGRPVPTPELFEYYTIRALATHLSTGIDVDETNLKQRCGGFAGASNEDIAVISMACRLPGGVATPEDFWELLRRGGDAITNVPKDRWDADELYDADPDAIDKSYCRQGGFLESVHSHDASFFGISPIEAQAMHPVQHLMLETCWEGFERAGYTKEQLNGSETGVFIGVSNNATTMNAAQADLKGYSITGSASATISGRLSYILGLEGPSMTVDTACSSSLVTTHLACNALRQGECDLAIAGGVSLLLTPGIHIEFSRLRGLSSDGRCRAFSADTQGTGFSEGSAFVVLKRLSDAQRDGDTIHTVLRGTAVSHGGRTASLTAPSSSSQARLIRKALCASGLLASDIDYIEAHGTATKLGDPIEGAALADVFGGSHSNAEPLWIGSSKSNIGHTGAAAGVVGMVKVVLALQHGVLPRTLHVAEPTPAVDWKGAKMALTQEEQHWLPNKDGRCRRRRAGISSFGIGGTGAHIIIEEPPKPAAELNQSQDRAPRPSLPSVMLFLVSGQTDGALRQQVTKLERYLGGTTYKDHLGDVAYSLATTRNHFRRRRVLMAKDKADLVKKLASASSSNDLAPNNATGEQPPHAHLAMLFTGQGSQLPGMGKILYQTYPMFRKSLDEVASYFAELGAPLLEVMWADAGSQAGTLLDRTDFAQPAIFALEVALWQLWHSWGVRPKAVLGHSVGEFAAAYAAGILDLPSVCRLVAARGRLMQALPSNGTMASLEASATEVETQIESLGLAGKVCIAGHNTPTQTVVSGDADATSSLVAQFAGRYRKAKMLNVSHAFHSHHIDGMLADFRAVAEKVQFKPPRIAIVCGRTGKLAEAGQLEQPDYWVQQARDAVRFSDGIKTLTSQGVNVFLELGPRPVLSGLGAACFGDNDNMDWAALAWLPSLVPGKDDAAVAQGSLAELHVRHVDIDWHAYFKPFSCRRVELPTYAFQREGPRPDGYDTQNTPQVAPLLARETAQRECVDRFKFEINWRQADTKLSGSLSLNIGSWGLLCPAGDVPWTSEVATALTCKGIEVLRVSQLQDAEELDGLLCLWDSDAPVLRQAHDMTANALTQLQAAARIGFSAPVIWVTRHAISTGPDDGLLSGLGAAPLWGLMRTARTEHPEMRLRLIDLREGHDIIDALALALMLEAEPECAVRNGQVLVPQIQRVDSPSSTVVPVPAEQQFIRRDGAVLITGGLGDIAQHTARWLAKTHGISDIVLTSRRGMEAPGAEALVGQLAQLGAKATIVAGNMGSLEGVHAIMTLFKGDRPLRGVVHTAGVLDDGVVSSLTPQRCSSLFKPKVDGAWHLHTLTKNMDLDLFIMCSSLSGIIGNAGQANYAAANTFLDALAHMRRAERLPATSVSLGLWGGEGMRARLRKSDLVRYSKIGMEPLVPEDGLELFKQLVLGGRPHTVAAVYILDKLRAYYEGIGGIPRLFQSLLGRGSKQSPLRSGGDLRKALSEADREQYGAIMLDTVRRAVAKTLGFVSPADVDVDRPLQDIGVDSLTAILTRNHLATLTGLTLSAKIVFEHPTVTALSQVLLSQVQQSLADTSSDEESGDGTSVTTTTTTATNPTTTLSGEYFLGPSGSKKEYLDPRFTFTASQAAASRPDAVFVTGATGFVGAFIVGELLELGIAVHCVIRAGSVDKARQRMVTALTDYGFWKPDFETLITTMVGDVAQPLFGLTEEAFDRLANQVDAVCHSAALVDWMRPLEDYIGPNVKSTQEVLRLASTGRGKAIHLISTVAVLPRYLGYDVSKDEGEYGYSTSKWMGEQMVTAARWRGAKASIYRLPYVTASASTGHFRLDRGDFLHNLVAGCVDMGSFPSMGDVDLSLVLPVDYLAKSIVAVMTKDLCRIGQDFTFGNTNAPSFNHYFELMSAVGSGEETLPFCTWREQALDYAAALPTSPLARIATVLDGCANDTDMTAMFKCPAVGENVLGASGYPVPSVDNQSIRRYLDRIHLARKAASIIAEASKASEA